MDRLRDLAQKINVWYENNLAPCRLTGILLLSAFYAYGVVFWYNLDMKELNCIAEDKAQIGKEFQRRADLARNMANIVDNYANHERILFQYVSDMRAEFQALEMADGAPSPAQGAKLEQVFLKLAALAEQYPELKAEQRFHDLMDMAEISEDRIADSMYNYIDSVWDYNVCNQCFWCNYFTYLISGLVPLPAYWEYYRTEYKYAPLVPAEGLPAPAGQAYVQASSGPAGGFAP